MIVATQSPERRRNLFDAEFCAVSSDTVRLWSPEMTHTKNRADPEDLRGTEFTFCVS